MNGGDVLMLSTAAMYFMAGIAYSFHSQGAAAGMVFCYAAANIFFVFSHQ